MYHERVPCRAWLAPRSIISHITETTSSRTDCSVAKRFTMRSLIVFHASRPNKTNAQIHDILRQYEVLRIMCFRVYSAWHFLWHPAHAFSTYLRICCARFAPFRDQNKLFQALWSALVQAISVHDRHFSYIATLIMSLVFHIIFNSVAPGFHRYFFCVLQVMVSQLWATASRLPC